MMIKRKRIIRITTLRAIIKKKDKNNTNDNKNRDKNNTSYPRIAART